MADPALDFWPSIEIVSSRTPVTILKQQATLLGKHTKNLLEGRVATIASAEGFLHRFLIYAPTLNYTFELFAVSHDVNLYPVRVASPQSGRFEELGRSLNSEEEFVDWLKAALNSVDTKRILATLLAQAES